MRRGTPKIRLVECEAAVQEIRNRMPFRYGKAVLTGSPLLCVRVRVETKDGKQAVGFSSDALPPLWFDKNPAKTYREEVEDQLHAFRAARHVYLNIAQKPLAASEIWEASYSRILEECQRRGINALTASFGGSFVERAMIDALLRIKQCSFFEALRSDLLGMETSRQLGEKPLAQIRCRHTVGLSDPLTQGGIREAERVDDGLPQALEDDIDFYGLSYFKVKISGEYDRDVERLSRIAALVHQRCREGYSITLDGNELYSDPNDFERLIEALKSKPYGAEFLNAVLYIEQPFPRETALSPEIAGSVARLAAMKPLIIDESDDRLDSFERAAQLGYLGVSHKNSKGIFKSLRNRAWILATNVARKKQKLPLLFQTGEDLACVPILPLQQDLVSLAALGIDHAEKNGHHYYRGLDHLPRREAESAAAAHADLYEERNHSYFLKIQNGWISVGSLNAPGYGYSCEIAFEDRTPLESWSFTGLEENTPHA